MLLCFGADFLETWISNVEYARDFAAWRQARHEQEHPARFVFLAPRLSLTGANADEWIPLRPGTEGFAARALAEIVSRERGQTTSGEDIGGLAQAAGISSADLQRLGKEFAAAPSLAFPVGVAGMDAQATAANEAILRLNVAAGNVGRTYLTDHPHALETTARHQDMAALIRSMQAGDIGLLLLHEANPAYSLPPSLQFSEAVKHVPLVVSFSSYMDETTSLASLVLPDNRPLESWGEYSPRPGVQGLMQPVVMPVFDTRPTGDVLLTTAARLGHDLGAADFRAYLLQHSGLNTEEWLQAVQRGGVFTAEPRATEPAVNLRDRAVVGNGAEATPEKQSTLEANRPTASTGPGAGPAARTPSSSPAASPPSVQDQLPESTAPTEHKQQATAGKNAPALPSTLPSTTAPALSTQSGLILHLYPSLHFFDGRTANRPWTQEIPDPMAKAVWGSWAEIHPDTASRLGIHKDDLLALTTRAGRLEVPALPTERVHPDVVAVQIGQGHAQYGRYAQNTGINAYALLAGDTEPGTGNLVQSHILVSVAKLPAQRKVITLQASQRMVGDDVAREMTFAEFTRKSAEHAAKPGNHAPEKDAPDVPTDARPPRSTQEKEYPSLYHDAPQDKHHWGMAIDLDRCIGCNACVAACYAENNVPIVGKDECSRGREMAWLRIENYEEPTTAQEPASAAASSGLSGSPPSEAVPSGFVPKSALTASISAPRANRIRFLPMLCQQCDNAPCEYVCPVNATVHSSDGLNQQVYNRCVGTRFCSNNCPYKVRRFNWYTYDFPAPLDQQLNPDVTHRSKGMMEKCTFCVQRIRRTRLDAEAAGRPLEDGQIMPACQQTCPADAIVFGDLNDPEQSGAPTGE